MKKNKINVAVMGLGFGTEFVPIHLEHPDVASVAICDANPQRLRATAQKFGIKKTFADVAQIVQSEEIDAVHLISGIPDHAKQTLAVLESSSR